MILSMKHIVDVIVSVLLIVASIVYLRARSREAYSS
jgi:hypothetical protein